MQSLRIAVAGGMLFFTLTLHARAQTVWTGLSESFSKAANADWTLAANQDAIMPNVIITRRNTEGIFNIAVENAFDRFTGQNAPADTEWAFASLAGNPAVVSASDWALLNFDTWTISLGGGGSLAGNILNRPGVLHLISDDIYLDIQFTGWGQGHGGGGSFSYNRAPEPATVTMLGLGGLAFLRRKKT